MSLGSLDDAIISLKSIIILMINSWMNSMETVLRELLLLSASIFAIHSLITGSAIGLRISSNDYCIAVKFSTRVLLRNFYYFVACFFKETDGGDHFLYPITASISSTYLFIEEESFLYFRRDTSPAIKLSFIVVSKYYSSVYY